MFMQEYLYKLKITANHKAVRPPWARQNWRTTNFSHFFFYFWWESAHL